VAELRGRGQPADFEQTRAEMEARDQRDSSRTVAPLRQADDAIYLDSSGLGPEEVVDRMAAAVEAAARSGSH
jgi:cytidylate kinase